VEVSVIGAGYVGLVTAACLANMGNRVRCIDIDPHRVERLRQGSLPFSEPNLDRLVRSGCDSGRLVFPSDPDAVRNTELAIVAVGTLDDAGEWTSATVEAAVLALAADRAAPRAIVIRSTLLPGTAMNLASRAGLLDPTVRLAVNPEFTREGSAVTDFLAPQRVVIGVGPGRSDIEGTVDDRERTLITSLRALFEPLDAPILVTDLTSAELIKVGSNVFLAAKITFANELARLSIATGGDPMAVVEGLGLDDRIGRAFLSPGPGYGGSCFPSQARALPGIARRAGVPTRLIDAIAPSNVDQIGWILEQAERALGEPVAQRRVALLGLTFKANTDDLRESPALRLAAALVHRGAEVVAFDPIATTSAIEALARSEGIALIPAGTVEVACTGADLAIVATEWPSFGSLDWTAIAPSMRRPMVLDARSVVDPAAVARAGMTVTGLIGSAPAGRTTSLPARQGPGRDVDAGGRVRPGRANHADIGAAATR